MTGDDRHTRVLLADDNLPVRMGLKRLITQEPDLEVVAETSDGQEALQLARTLEPDVALVDVSMPGWDGVRLAREMSSACPSMKVIAVTRHNDGGFLHKMIEAGARGYVLKQNATTTLVKAVRTCMGGVTYVDAGVRSSARTSANAVAAMPVVQAEHEPLTEIEDDILRLFGSASTLQGIAEQLGLEYEEVVRLKNAAMRKLGFTSRLQATNYVRSRNPDTPS
jgi:DNA-binding NarL/FixJ family response regulator